MNAEYREPRLLDCRTPPAPAGRYEFSPVLGVIIRLMIGQERKFNASMWLPQKLSFEFSRGASCHAGDLARHAGELLPVRGDLVLRDVELHCKKGVVTNDSRHVDNSLRPEARLGTLKCRIGNLLVP